MMLQLPVPVLHEHDSFDAHEVLAKHVARHHAGERSALPVVVTCDEGTIGSVLNVVQAHADEDPHWHLVLPSQWGHCGATGDESPANSSLQAMPVSSSLLSFVDSISVEVRALAVCWEMWQSRGHDSSMSPLQLASNASSVSSFEKPLVMRC